jgi:hypothetical protein
MAKRKFNPQEIIVKLSKTFCKRNISCFTDGTQSIGICEDCQKIRTIIREMVR